MVNALSEWCRVIVKRENEVVIQEYVNGGKVARPVEKLDPKKPTTKIKGAEWGIDLQSWDYESGTIVQFLPDKTIFETINFENKFFIAQLREYAYLTAGIKFELIDARNDTNRTFYFEGGIKAYLRSLNRNKAVLNPTPFYVKRDYEDVAVEVAVQYNDSFTENVVCFANHLKNSEGGTHVTGFRAALTKVVNDYARQKGFLKEKDAGLSGDDLREGLTAIISVNLDSADLQFEGQTKAKLGNTNLRTAVETVVKEALESYMQENPRDAQAVIEKNVLALKARMAAKAARDTVIRKTALEGGGVLPGKLADCSLKDKEKTEIFIVEGDSAGGCFSGSTKVALVDGRNLTFEEIVKEQNEGKEHFCYTIRKDGKIGTEQFINARIMKTDAKVVKVTLDNNEEIICTPDHQFMLRGGNYEEASKLESTHSLMPLYRKHSSKKEPGITIYGYEMVWDPKSDGWLFTHVLADWYNRWKKTYTIEHGNSVHHKDFDKLNNSPTNLIRLNKEAHLEIHRNMLEKTLRREDVKEFLRNLQQTNEYRKKMSTRMKEPQTRAILSNNAKEQWRNEAYKKHMGEKWQEFFSTNEQYRKENSKQLQDAQKAYWSKEENRIKQSEKTKEFYKNNPKARSYLSASASKQWLDENLLKWRSEKTKQQWTSEFRAKRKTTLTKTYYNKTIKKLKQFSEGKAGADIKKYDEYRIETKDKSLLKFDKFVNDYFGGSWGKASEAISNYNHKAVRVEKLMETYTVYDAEVPGTHNFALASGIFVHNSAKQGRDRNTQAILPLFGKVLNTERARLDKIVDSDKFKTLIIAIGAGIGDQYDASKLRYGKVIIMADADADGMHIMALYLTFFFRHMPEIINKGHIHVAVPPLFKATWGKEKQYLFDDHERDKFLKTANGPKAIIQRFKGLGEMNANELWETTMDPATRKLKLITIEDAAHADEIFSMLMGEEVAPRKRFIQTHAKQAILDIT